MNRWASRLPAATTSSGRSGHVLRAAVRRKGGPFVARDPFEDGDETALTEADEGSPAATSAGSTPPARSASRDCPRLACVTTPCSATATGTTSRFTSRSIPPAARRGSPSR